MDFAHLDRDRVTADALVPGPARSTGLRSVMRPALFALLAVLVPVPAIAETFDGRRAIITDGDTIALGSERVRILNIDAPWPARFDPSAPKPARGSRRRPCRQARVGLKAFSVRAATHHIHDFIGGQPEPPAGLLEAREVVL